MGLDITAYSKLRAVGPKTDDSDLVFWDNPDFPGRSEGVDCSLEYEAADQHGFCAGSYGGYNNWRNELAKLAGWNSAQHVWSQSPDSGPFVELINFADNEGTIGPVVAAKLAKDFADHQALADASTNSRFADVYNEFRKAFEMAADGGAVSFH
jgi:hypothetical protein